MHQFVATALTVFFVGSMNLAKAQQVEVDDSGETGKAKVQKYFSKRKSAAARAPANDDEGRAPAAASSGAPRYLALHIGTFIDDQGYKWGHGDQKDIGQFNMGVTYRVGEWVNSMDFSIRAEYTAYTLTEQAARKLSFLAMVTFPDVNSRFPLYFGVGAGPGFFIKQLHGQSEMSLDYQVVAGARFLNVIDTTGFFAEFGLKNDIHIFSEGQYNGLFVGGGAAWTF